MGTIARQQTTDNRQQTTDIRQQISDNRQQTTESLFITSDLENHTIEVFIYANLTSQSTIKSCIM